MRQNSKGETMLKTFSVIANSATLIGMVAFGAYNIKDVAAQEYVNHVSQEDKYCLQQNVYFEARNQSELGKRAVAWVTLNRVDDSRYPDTICEVVWQKSQFSWTKDGKSDVPSENIIEQRAWKRAEQVVESVLFKYYSGADKLIGDAVMFHADYVSPYWMTHYEEVATIDDHIFYE